MLSFVVVVGVGQGRKQKEPPSYLHGPWTLFSSEKDSCRTTYEHNCDYFRTRTQSRHMTSIRLSCYDAGFKNSTFSTMALQPQQCQQWSPLPTLDGSCTVLTDAVTGSRHQFLNSREDTQHITTQNVRSLFHRDCCKHVPTGTLLRCRSSPSQSRSPTNGCSNGIFIVF
jgi:hypothetical protein